MSKTRRWCFGRPGALRVTSWRYERRVIPVAGHFISRKTPGAMVQAVLDLR
jgi:hypothetical protein